MKEKLTLFKKIFRNSILLDCRERKWRVLNPDTPALDLRRKEFLPSELLGGDCPAVLGALAQGVRSSFLFSSDSAASLSSAKRSKKESASALILITALYPVSSLCILADTGLPFDEVAYSASFLGLSVLGGADGLLPAVCDISTLSEITSGIENVFYKDVSHELNADENTVFLMAKDFFALNSVSVPTSDTELIGADVDQISKSADESSIDRLRSLFFCLSFFIFHVSRTKSADISFLARDVILLKVEMKPEFLSVTDVDKLEFDLRGASELGSFLCKLSEERGMLFAMRRDGNFLEIYLTATVPDISLAGLKALLDPDSMWVSVISADTPSDHASEEPAPF